MHWITQHSNQIAPIVGGILGILAAILAYFSRKNKQGKVSASKPIAIIAIIIAAAGFVMLGIVLSRNFGS
jgi:heme/copper-type cytochrome/quinol oxidase subunit 2